MERKRIRVALSGTPWVARQMRETVEYARESGIEWADLTQLRSQSLALGPLGKALRVIEFAFGLRGVDILLQVYADRHAAWKTKVAELLGKSSILYWIGSDCYGVLQGIDSDIVLRMSDRVAANLGCGPSAMSELETLGVTATEYITPPKLDSSLSKMPDRHAVLISVPDGREDFYGYPDLRKLIDDFPDTLFHVVRSSKQSLWEADNVAFWGVIPSEKMNEVFDCVSIVIRYPEHDSTSMILMESAIKGKRIISRNPFPSAWLATTYDELCDSMRKALSEPVEPHIDVREKALRLYDRKRAGMQLAQIIRSVA